MKELGITYSATIQDTPDTQIHLTTAFFGGTWYWYGFRHDMTRKMEILERYQSDPASFWLTSEEAMADAVATFDGSKEEEIDSCEDDYPYDIIPTGWDAQDHKALYE